jgi:hypothetical protein
MKACRGNRDVVSLILNLGGGCGWVGLPSLLVCQFVLLLSPVSYFSVLWNLHRFLSLLEDGSDFYSLLVTKCLIALRTQNIMCCITKQLQCHCVQLYVSFSYTSPKYAEWKDTIHEVHSVKIHSSWFYLPHWPWFLFCGLQVLLMWC